jgi:hypothetical protein
MGASPHPLIHPLLLPSVTPVPAALGIDVPPDLLDRWRTWFAPHLQPFNTTHLGRDAAGLGRPAEPTLSLRDTFHVYGDGNWTWLEEPEFTALDLGTKRALLRDRAATGRVSQLLDEDRAIAKTVAVDSRIVWWPDTLRRAGDQPLLDYVENGLPPSRHQEVTRATWSTGSHLLPLAGDLAGRLPASSGPNCFSAVLAAAGAGPASDWTHREPFEQWLARRTHLVHGTHRDHLPGVVLTWRNHDGLAEHAAVTIGEGYALNKPSQGWFSPYLVWTVKETIAFSRYRGAVLSRYLITP